MCADTIDERGSLQAPEPIALKASPEAEVLAVMEAIAALRQRKTGWLGNVTSMLISVALFIVIMGFGSSASTIAIVVGVLLVHEFGHLVAMRVFRYRDIRMLFIPFLGAVISAQNVGVAAHKKAIVSLAGPVPGILLAGVLLAAGAMTKQSMLLHAAFLMLLINGFNLLPVFPLDGGRLMRTVIFCRSHYLEAIFIVGAGVALLALTVFLEFWLLGLIGIMTIIGARGTFKTAAIAAELESSMPVQTDADVYDIPAASVAMILPKVRERFSYRMSVVQVAGVVQGVWERLNMKPPETLGTIFLLAVYGAAWVAALAVLIGYALLSNVHLA